MITLATEPFQSFIDFLNAKQLVDIPCELAVLPKHDVIETPDGGKGFALYLAGGNAIYVAGDLSGLDMSEQEQYESQLECIGHEYAHHLQHCRGGGINNDPERAEAEAESQARSWVEEFLAQMKSASPEEPDTERQSIDAKLKQQTRNLIEYMNGIQRTYDQMAQLLEMQLNFDDASDYKLIAAETKRQIQALEKSLNED